MTRGVPDHLPTCQDGIAQRLATVDLLRPLAERPEHLRMLAQITEPRQYRAGVRVVEEGQAGSEMYIINQGRVQVLKRTLYQDEYTVASLEAGQCFGDMALMDEDRRSATVVAETDCELLAIRRDRFLALGDQHPDLGLAVTRAIATHLCTRLRAANADVVTLFAALVHQVEDERPGRRGH